MELKERLEQESAGWRAMNANPGAWLMQEFVVRKGRVYPARSLPSKFPKMEPRFCFSNAASLMKRRRNLRYCEGFAARPDWPIVFHHAWVVDTEDGIIDPTLDDPTEYEYVGVPYTREQYRAAHGKKRTPALFLSDEELVNARFLFQQCPELRDLVDPVLLDRFER